jgi:hypothetical protein
MRDLYANELQFVTGAGDSPCPPTAPVTKQKGNNGFGNGSDAPNTAAPGNSGSTGGGKEGSFGDGRGAR